MKDQIIEGKSTDSWIRVYIRVRPLLNNEIGQQTILKVKADVILSKSFYFYFFRKKQSS